MMHKKLKGLLIAAALLPSLSFAEIYSLPDTECTGITAMLNTGPGSGCKITATKQDYDSTAEYGHVHARLYLPGGATLADAPNQVALDKLIVFVDGFSPADVYYSQSLPVSEGEYYEPFDNRTPEVLGISDIRDTEGAAILVVKLQIHEQDSLQDNAYAIEQLLTFLSSYRNNNRNIVMAGYSIGGVAVRYALADMEKAGVNHHVNLYVSYDAPHQGAYVPQSLQFILPIIDAYLPDMTNFANSIPTTDKLAAAAQELRNVAYRTDEIIQQFRQTYTVGISGKTLSSTIGDQFVIDNIHNASLQPALVYALRANGLPNSNGYPVTNGIKKIALTNGSLSNNVLPTIDLDENAPNPGAYFHFRGIKGDTGQATLSQPLKAYAFADMALFPTSAGAVAATSNLGLRANWTFRAGCFIFFTCTYTGNAAANLPQQRNADSAAREWDRIPGGHVDVGAYLHAISAAVNSRGIFDQVDYSSSIYNNYFSFVPSFSAVDSTSGYVDGSALSLLDTPFDMLYSNGDNNETTSGFVVVNNNQEHEYVSLHLVAEDIRDALFSLAPPADVITAFSSAPLSGNGNLTGNYGVLSGNVCSSISKAATGQYPQAEQQLMLASGKADILFNQGKISQQQHDALVDWLALLLQVLQQTPTNYVVEANAALNGTVLSCQ